MKISQPRSSTYSFVKLRWCYRLHRCCLQVVTNGINDVANGITKLRRQILNDTGNLRGQTNENKPGSLAEHNKEFLGVRPKDRKSVV